MKKLSNLKGVKTLSKRKQKTLNGGMPFNKLCPKGCFTPYIQEIGGIGCAVLGSNVNLCSGTMIAGQCCT